MELEKQKLLIKYLISSQELFTKVSPILQTQYFDPKLKKVVAFVKDYFETYKAPPTPEQLKAETSFEIAREELTRPQINYAETELETFCRNKAIESAILASPKLLEEQKFGDIEKLIKDAITVSLQRNIGTDYSHDPELRLKQLLLKNNTTPTGILKLDEHLGGGINRKEMTIVAAPSGVGKSVTMSNIGRNLMKKGLNGVYFTMELSEEVVSKRFDSMFSGMSQTDILQNITKTAIEVKKQTEGIGRLFIKRMPESSTNANHLRAYLKEFEIVTGYTPDFIIVDYLDLMASVQSVSVENQFIKDKYVSEELRAIANDFNCFMITASQLNRGAQQVESIEDLGQAHIAGGISKINTTDNLIAIIQTNLMKARGEMMFKLLKTRSSAGVGNYFILKFNPVTLLLENIDEEGARPAKSLSSFIKKDAVQASSESQTASKINPNNLPFQV